MLPSVGAEHGVSSEWPRGALQKYLQVIRWT
jgi:hypothetical protein